MREYQEQLYAKLNEVKNTLEVAVLGNKGNKNKNNTNNIRHDNTARDPNEATAESDDNISKDDLEKCCCCDTFVHGMANIRRQIVTLKDAVSENKSLHSTIIEEDTSSDVKAPTSTAETYKWEKHSSGAARKAVNKMGYGGKGLGKNENGIQDALTAENIGGNLQNQKKPDTMIFSSSILKGINTNGFNKGYKNKTAKFQKFHGRTAGEIKSYMPVNLAQGKPDTVVIAASGNGIPTGPKCAVPLKQIVDEVVQSGKLCKDHGVKTVYISSFLPRRSLHYQSRRDEMNKLLKEQCKLNGFMYMANTNIEMKHHLAEDGVHLNSDGSSILCRNMLYHLNKGS